MAKRILGFNSPFVAECMAFCEGHQFAVDSGLQINAIERDSIQVVPCCEQPNFLAPAGLIVGDIFFLFRVQRGSSCCYFAASQMTICCNVTLFLLKIYS